MTLLKICKWNRQTQKKSSLPYMCIISPNSLRLLGLNMLQHAAKADIPVAYI